MHEKSEENDVAIIKLKSALAFNGKVKPACIPCDDWIPNIPDMCFVSGWGHSKESKISSELFYN